MKKFAMTMMTLAAVTCAQLTLAGPLDPDCTAEKAAKSTAAKTTVGVGGRCSPTEAAKDTAKGVAGVEDKGPLEKKGNDDKATDAAKGAAKKTGK